MKTRFKHIAGAFALIAIHLSPFAFRLDAGVPLAWEVRPGQPAPVMFDRYHGETLAFSATFRGFGELPFGQDADVRLWYQTNGMGSAWWSAPATIRSNILSAVWSPALDPGAERVSLFFGAPSNAYAAAVLRLRHSPGFAPGAMPDPESFRESDPVFAAWLSTYVPPETSLEPATNYTDRALGDFAATGAVARALTYGTPNRWTDATGCVWEVVIDSQWSVEYKDPEYGPQYGIRIKPSGLGNGMYWVPMVGESACGVAKGDEDSTILVWEGDAITDFTATRTLVVTTNLVGRAALTNDLPNLAPIRRELQDIRTESALVYRLYHGSNVVAEVTNYNSQVHAPELRLMQLNESNEYITVWSETKGLARTLARANEYTDAAISNRAAPRAWSRTTSGLGAEAPSNITWISTPTTVIAGGFEYAKFVDTYGEVWVLTSNGMVAEFNPDTNAYFRISADDGTPIFSVEKTDAQVVGANASGITVGESGITIPVPVVSATAPTMYWRYSLSSGDWADETAVNPSYMAVDWTGGPGTWVCNISFDGTRPSSMVFKFSFIQEGSVVIRNNATTDLSSGIYVNGTKYVPVANGSTLTWQAAQ